MSIHDKTTYKPETIDKTKHDIDSYISKHSNLTGDVKGYLKQQAELPECSAAASTTYVLITENSDSRKDFSAAISIRHQPLTEKDIQHLSTVGENSSNHFTRYRRAGVGFVIDFYTVADAGGYETDRLQKLLKLATKDILSKHPNVPIFYDDGLLATYPRTKGRGMIKELRGAETHIFEYTATPAPRRRHIPKPKYGARVQIHPTR